MVSCLGSEIMCKPNLECQSILCMIFRAVLCHRRLQVPFRDCSTQALLSQSSSGENGKSEASGCNDWQVFAMLLNFVYFHAMHALRGLRCPKDLCLPRND